MLVRGYKIVSPRRFEVYIEEVDAKKDQAIIEIDKAAVCKADLRYYLGNRDKKVLGLKYPMNLLHEAVGIVMKDPTGSFNIGDKVVMVPNLSLECNDKMCIEKIHMNSSLGENYCPRAYFASSNYNGFSRDIISYPVKNLVRLGSNIPNSIGVYSELISVACSAIRRIKIEENETVAIWGDGILGYILCCTLKELCKCNVVVIGRHVEKLEVFHADKYFISGDKDIEKIKINHAFECVGGNGSENAINEIISTIFPGGNIVLTGVAENNISINTRKILEKGLTITGSTRSNISDFESAVSLLENESFREKVSILIIEEKNIKNINDFTNVFELEVNNKKLGKYVMNFEF